jgi:small-conductance mechanosensitive channel
MKRFFSEMNPFVRGLLVVALIAGIVVVLQLQLTLTALFLIASIIFPLAIAYFLYLLWRDRRDDVAVWPARSKFAFYGGAVLIVAALLVFFFRGASGLDALALLLVLGFSGFAMFRAWRDQHTYGY